jgi:hypothetical protein
MPTRDEAIEKVIKVLRLARGAGTEQEAQTALLTAQRLMYAHDIAGHEVAAEPAAPDKAARGAAKEAIREIVLERAGQRRPWHETLAAVIAENFRCAYLISYSRSTRAVSLIFIGRTSDATVAAEAYFSAAAAAGALADAFALHRADRSEAQQSYLIGFLKGLYERFQESRSQTALLLVTEPEIVAHATALANGGEARGEPLAAHDADALRDGYASGFQYGSSTRPLKD